MISRTLILSLLIAVAGCGGDGSSSGTSFSWQPGIYTGTFTQSGFSPDNVLVIVTSDMRFALANLDGTEYALGSTSGGQLSTSDGFTATLTNTLSGNYTAPGVTGTFSLVDAGIYGRNSSTAKLEGTWVDNTFTQITGATTYVIDASGNISFTSVSSCSGTGLITPITTSSNEYNFSLNVTNCASYDGVYGGIAITDDTFFTDDTIDIVAENLPADAFLIGAPVKQ